MANPAQMDIIPFHNVVEVLHKAKDDMDNLMAKLMETPLSKPTASQWAHINQYMCAYACLHQGQRPGIIETMRVCELQQTVAIERNGAPFHVVRISDHKTTTSYIGQLTLTQYWKKFFDDYVTIRAAVMAASDFSTNELIVNGLGKNFQRATDAVAKIQQRYDMPVMYRNMHARRAIQTGLQNMTEPARAMVAHYIGISTDMADRVHVAPDLTKCIESSLIIGDLVEYSKTHATTDLPTALPSYYIPPYL
jgi:hypothetical protein